MNYRKANSADIFKIKSLWEEVFGDADDYINRFITHFGITTCYVCERNSKIVSMAFALPATLALPRHCGEGKLKYLYACATHPQHQNQGIMQSLLSTIYNDACNENIAGIFLHPAKPYLADYYRKLGFEEFFHRDHFWYYKEKLLADESIPLSPLNFISPETYHQKRTQKLEKKCFINWNEDFFRFINEKEVQLCEFGNTIFAYKTWFNNIIVDELLGDMPHEQVARLLIEHLPDFETVNIRLQGNEFCCGQIRWCKSLENMPKNGYFAFAME
ncbi:MAG: GNAT family N-acetyltransferase [Lentimicrobiaceae bacterium]|nr:GNAT family N-acetyltransferase [Lentimicrobiaceae bacterium]